MYIRTCVRDPHFQLNKKRELEGQIADLKTDLAPLDKQLEDMLSTSRRHTSTLLWLGMSLPHNILCVTMCWRGSWRVAEGQRACSTYEVMDTSG